MAQQLRALPALLEGSNSMSSTNKVTCNCLCLNPQRIICHPLALRAPTQTHNAHILMQANVQTHK